ncbi:MAG: hypothetical protein JKP95_03860 [Oceanicaulis sp.]|nr:hypothetical protein [Oceanicaulis sp.]
MRLFSRFHRLSCRPWRRHAGPGRHGSDGGVFRREAGANRVRLIKDVDGVYTDDPAKDPHAQRYDALDYDQAMDASRGLIQPKAIEAAKAANLVVEVAAMARAKPPASLRAPQSSAVRAIATDESGASGLRRSRVGRARPCAEPS